MRVGFAITDPTGGGAHYRARTPARVLRHFGHEVVVGPTVRYGDGEWRLGIELDAEADAGGADLERIETFTDEAGGDFSVFVPDVLVFTAGWAMGLDQMLDIGRMNGAGGGGRNVDQRLVVDFDDGLQAPADNAGYHPGQLERKLAAALAVDRLTVSTPHVARDLSAVKRPTYVVRNLIDAGLFAEADAVNRARLGVRIADEVVGDLVLGFRGPLPWHLEDVRTLREGAAGLVERGCRFVHIGARDDDPKSFAELLGVSEGLVERRPHVPFAEYPALLAGVDVGIVPFARRPWSGYKSNIGALEWTAAGVPWISSDQPEYRKLDPGSLVAGRFGWASRIRDLLEPTARFDRYAKQLAAAARHDVNATLARGRNRGWEIALGLID